MEAKATGWTEVSDTSWNKQYGPFTVVLYRRLNYDFHVEFVGVDGLDFEFPCSDTGKEWWDDAEFVAMRIADKKVKSIIRSWAK